MMLRQWQWQTGRAGMMLQNRAVDQLEELFRIQVHVILLRPVTVKHFSSRAAAPRGEVEIRLRQFFPQRLSQCARHSGGQLDQVEGVAIAFIKLNLTPAQCEHLIPIGRLPDAQQRLGVKTVGHHGKLRH